MDDCLNGVNVEIGPEIEEGDGLTDVGVSIGEGAGTVVVLSFVAGYDDGEGEVAGLSNGAGMGDGEVLGVGLTGSGVADGVELGK